MRCVIVWINKDDSVRIENHPILTFDRGEAVAFTFDGETLESFAGETVAAALLANGIDVMRHSGREHRPRGFYCGIGRCSSCNMIIDGVPNTRACVTPVQAGMVVETQNGYGAFAEAKIDGASL